MKKLGKEEFLQQYVLARAQTLALSMDARGVVKDAIKVYELIQKEIERGDKE